LQHKVNATILRHEFIKLESNAAKYMERNFVIEHETFITTKMKDEHNLPLRVGGSVKTQLFYDRYLLV